MSILTTTSWVALFFVLAATARHRHSYYATTTASGGTLCPNCLLNHANDDGKFSDKRTDALRLEAIKHQILSKLGLSAKPNITRGVTGGLPRDLVLKTLSRSHGSSSSTSSSSSKQDSDMSSSDDFFATTSEIIAFAEPGPRLNGQRLVEFLPPVDGPELRVKSAVLWVRLEQKRSAPSRNVTFWAFRLVSNHLPNTTHLSGKAFDTHAEVVSSARITSPGWQRLDLRRAVSEWYSRRPTDRLRLLVDCSGCGSSVGPALFASGQSRRPYLMVRTEPALGRRVRRRALDCTGPAQTQCCKQTFYVSFKLLGWDDWVIAPQGYYANYCRGDCSGLRRPDTISSQHSHVIEEYRRIDRLAGLQPCCTPIKFSSTSIIYYGEEMTIIKRDLPKMVVEECGCP